MTRLKRPPDQHPARPANASLAIRSDDVLPEHVLLRWLHQDRVVATGVQPDVEYALQLASVIAANQALTEPILESDAIQDGQGAPDDDEWSEQECFDLNDLVNEFEIVSVAESDTEHSERLEDVTMSNEFDDGTASTTQTEQEHPSGPSAADVLDQQESMSPRTDHQESASPNAGGEVADELGAISPPANSESTAADAGPSKDERRMKRISASRFEEAELGALMADIIPPATDPFEEQENLQRRFREPDDLVKPISSPSIKTGEVESPESETLTAETPRTEALRTESQPEATTDRNSGSQDSDAASSAEHSHASQLDDATELAKDATQDQEAAATQLSGESDASDSPPPDELPPMAEAEARVEVEAGAEVVDGAEAEAEVVGQAEAEDVADSVTPETGSHAEPDSMAEPIDVATEPSLKEIEELAAESNESSDDVAADQQEPTAELPEAPTSVDVTPTEQADVAATNMSMDRVQDFLGELKHALVEIAHRPEPAAMDIGPLVQALQTGFDRSAEQALQTSTAVASLSEHMTQFGRNIEGGVAKTIDSLGQRPAASQAATPAAATPRFVERSTSNAVTLGAVALAVIGWSILFWIKTGSPRLALGTLIGANAIACCLLLARRDRS